MGITVPAIGWFVLPATALLLIFRRDLLLPWALFLSFFEAASAVNLVYHRSPFGVQPGLFGMAVGCLAWLLFKPNYRRMPGSRALQWIAGSFAAFALYALCSSYLIPHALEGQIYVYPSTRQHALAPLHFYSVNATQDFYVLVVGAGFLLVAWAVYSSRDGRLWRNLINALLLGGTVAGLIGLYQQLASGAGLYFPRAFFQSNPRYAQANQYMGALHRLSASFSEPSFAAFFLSGAVACALWLALYRKRAPLAWVTLFTALPALVLTTSTTAYFALAVLTLVAIASLLLRMNISPRTLAGLAIIAVVTLVGVGLLLQRSRDVTEVLNGAILHKAQSVSFSVRHAENVNAWDVTWQTDGAGVGWGSTRCSSMALNLLANAGVPGTLALLLCVALIAVFFRKARSSLLPETRAEMDAMAFAVCIMAVAGAAAVPDIMQIPLWVGLAAIAGLSARAWEATRARRAALKQAGSLARAAILAGQR
ncbi:MAG: hypothetical protein ACRD04_01020 [Terriglobales bacterium]